MLEPAVLILFPLLMAYAASSDLLTMTISNRISIALVVGFVAIAIPAGLPLVEIGWHLACGFLVLVITFSLFAFGWIGGGDAKLAAATSVWMGWGHVMEYGLVASFAGAALTLLLLQLRRWPLPARIRNVAWIERLHEPKGGIPYGIALAAAGLLVYPDSVLWLRVVVG
ncbi:MAG: prepilin peptidase [Beijerinckiaceae bacterium]|nr:prepilin peptidase [Beijerinckiaceae bacterium]MDO9439989.1 prepilin peptidase [Beijerinckiaceae bacterium]